MIHIKGHKPDFHALAKEVLRLWNELSYKGLYGEEADEWVHEIYKRSHRGMLCLFNYPQIMSGLIECLYGKNPTLHFNSPLDSVLHKVRCDLLIYEEWDLTPEEIVKKRGYLRISELPKEEQNLFRHWMMGQTIPLIDDLEPQDAVYLHDYEHWKSGGRPLD